jgi:hypothetical protein
MGPVTVEVYLEVGAKRTFANAIAWPGWSRSARDEDAAIEALFAYAPRYADAVVGTSPTFTVPTRVGALVVVQRVRGNATTDFGAPSAIPDADRERLDARAGKRLAALHSACWGSFLRGVKDAGDRPLAKGPRGGGRETAKILEHVVKAEGIYIRKLGLEMKSLDPDVLSASFATALRAISSGVPIEPASGVRDPWPPRYAVRRSAWHLLDHLWEIEDKLP